MEGLDTGDGYAVRDIGLAEEGSRRVDWARSRMPVLAALKEEAERSKPLAGMRVAGCLHVTKETAVLIETIAAALSESRDAIEEVIEPYLLQAALIQRSPRGRMLGSKAWSHLGLPVPKNKNQDDLFDELDR